MKPLPLLSDRERDLLDAVSRLAYGNPFGPERIEWERQALAAEFVASDLVWHSRADSTNPNVPQIAARAEELAREVEDWIRVNLGLDYPWPGNVRELAQCVNNILIRGEYQPAGDGGAPGVHERLTREYPSSTLSAEDLLRRYCTLVYARAGSYEEAARRLGLDRRTVKSRVDPILLRELGTSG